MPFFLYPVYIRDSVNNTKHFLHPFRPILTMIFSLLLVSCNWLEWETETNNPVATIDLSLPYGCHGIAAMSPYLPTYDAVRVPARSMARFWDEAILEAIRTDMPKPTVHARNLYHLSAAMYDAWAIYDSQADGRYFQGTRVSGSARERDETIAFAAYRILEARYLRAAFPDSTLAGLRVHMVSLGLDPCYIATEAGTAAALGNTVARTVLSSTINDGANEGNDYKDTSGWMPVNEPLVVANGGASMADPNQFQLLFIKDAISQNGIQLPDALQTYIGAHWGAVETFALRRSDPDVPYVANNVLPAWDSTDMQDLVLDLIGKSAALDNQSVATIDISPSVFGNNSLGTNDGTGRSLNPVTGVPYSPQRVFLADYGRAIAEFWADGPRSETPPGHWNVLANDATDALGAAPLYRGTGAAVDLLEWDIKLYFALNGALHDAAIGAWDAKRHYLGARPISLIRYRADLGQSSDPELPAYNSKGLPLVAGLIELITEASSAAGMPHAHLKAHVGQVAVRSWLGEGNATADNHNVDWKLGRDWVPYQRETFVTPAFPGYISGHSTFSRAAAEVIANFTGSEFFPGGLYEHEVLAGIGLAFEAGPTTAVTLQWATYFDAADQAGLSRLWGGIHVVPDDLEGRRTGHHIGIGALAEAERWFDGSAIP